jgi:GTPase SAR1 family protein
MSPFFNSAKKAGASQVFSPPSPPEYDLSSTMVDPIFDFQFRVILIGDSTVGKSSLLRNFTDGTFAEVSDPTVGVDFFARLLKVRDGTTVKLQLWDTAGQVRK